MHRIFFPWHSLAYRLLADGPIFWGGGGQKRKKKKRGEKKKKKRLKLADGTDFGRILVTICQIKGGPKTLEEFPWPTILLQLHNGSQMWRASMLLSQSLPNGTTHGGHETTGIPKRSFYPLNDPIYPSNSMRSSCHRGARRHVQICCRPDKTLSEPMRVFAKGA